MSTQDLLDALVARRVLRKWEPARDPDEGEYRCIYLSPSVDAWLNPPYGADRRRRHEAIDARRFLKSFVVGVPFDDVSRLKNLDVDDLQKQDRGIFEIKVVRRPQERIFGGFVERNLFVAVDVHQRNRLPKTEWIQEKQAIVDHWHRNYVVTVLDSQGRPSASRLPRLIGMSKKELTSNVRPET